MILETERLYLRELEGSDYDSLCKILQDPEVMYAYEGPFSDAEVREGWSVNKPAIRSGDSGCGRRSGKREMS